MDNPSVPRIPMPNLRDLACLAMPKVPEFDPSALRIPEFRMPEIPPPPKDHNLASEFHRRLVKWIGDFDASLDQAHEVGVRLVSFGQTIVFHLDDIGYWNPALISF